MSGLHAAATALLQEASEETALTVLRLLIDSVAPAPARTPQAPSPPAPRPAPSRPKAAAAAPPLDPAWDELRRQVRAAMATRGLNYPDIAQAIGRSAVALKIDLSRRQPPRPALRDKLQAWLEQAPAVAAPLPFRRNGAGNGSYGSTNTDNGYGDSATADV